MTFFKFFVVLAVAVVLQASVFAWRYSDLLYLSRPVPAIVDGGPERFASRAEEALARRRVTTRHLDRIADAAAEFEADVYERRALERRLALTPEDNRVRLRLAELLARAGETAEAEQLYLDVLRASEREAR